METMNNLIPMTQFVLNHHLYFNPLGTDEQSRVFDHIVNYAKLLSQPLTLSMFVPVSEAGEVLEEPIMYKAYIEGRTSYREHLPIISECKVFQEAKSRCLFEGFSLRKQYYLGAHILEVIYNNYPVLHYNSATKEFYDLSTEEYLIDRVELLIEYAGQTTLTPAAKELIYGK